MVSSDYTQEAGLETGRKEVSKPVAFAILAVLAIGAVFAVRELLPAAKQHEAPATVAKVP
jgi:hypothetical protein